MMPRLFTFVVGDAWRVRDMREKMRSSNGRERPKAVLFETEINSLSEKRWDRNWSWS